MRCRSIICLCIVAAAFVEITVAIPLDDERASSLSKKRTARNTKESLYSTRHPSPSEYDDDFESKFRPQTSKREYGIEDSHGSNADVLEKPELRHDNHDIEDTETNLSVQQPQDALSSGFFQALGRFFGLSADKPAAKAISKSEKREASGDKVGALLDELEVEDEDVMKKMDGKRAERESSYSSTRRNMAERWGNSFTDDGPFLEKERSKDDDDPDGRGLQAAPPTPTPTSKAKKEKDGEDYLSDSDVRDIVQLFRRLFSSLEKSLKDKSEVGSSTRIPHGSKPIKRAAHEALAGFGDMYEEGQETEDEEASSRLTFGRTAPHSRPRKAKGELPDVRVALAAAESLNRQREAERKMEEEGAERESEREERAKVKTGGRTRSGEKWEEEEEEEEEDMAADDEREERVEGRKDRELPRSAPAWVARKRLLRTRGSKKETERGEREGWGQEREHYVTRIMDKIADGFHSVF